MSSQLGALNAVASYLRRRLLGGSASCVEPASASSTHTICVLNAQGSTILTLMWLGSVRSVRSKLTSWLGRLLDPLAPLGCL